MRDETLLLDEIPAPAAIQLELGRVLRRAAFLRRLLKLSLEARERLADGRAAPTTEDREFVEPIEVPQLRSVFRTPTTKGGAGA